MRFANQQKVTTDFGYDTSSSNALANESPESSTLVTIEEDCGAISANRVTDNGFKIVIDVVTS